KTTKAHESTAAHRRAFAAIEAKLGKEAQAETFRYALRVLARETGAIGDAAKTLLAEGTVSLGPALEAIAPKLTTEQREEAARILDAELTVFRNGKRFVEGFSIEPVKMPPKAVRDTSNVLHGFSKGVTSFVGGAHSMHEL